MGSSSHTNGWVSGCTGTPVVLGPNQPPIGGVILGIVFPAVAAIAILVSVLWIPVLKDMVVSIALNATAMAGTPLVPIVNLFPVFLFVLIAVAIAWGASRQM